MCLSNWDEQDEREYEEGNRVLDAAEASGELAFDDLTLFGDIDAE